MSEAVLVVSSLGDPGRARRACWPTAAPRDPGEHGHARRPRGLPQSNPCPTRRLHERQGAAPRPSWSSGSIAQTAVDNETYFCELDAVVGDGDFGYSLARGFEIVAARLGRDRVRATSAALLKKTAIVLTKRIGGTSGPIWGTAFLRAGGVAGATTRSRPASDVIAALRAAIEGIKQRGDADLGDKTLLDALVPGRRRARGGAARGRRSVALERAAAVARTSAEATKGMLAQRGRASYTGERSRDSVGRGRDRRSR